MRTFRTYRDLLESELIDKFVLERIISRWSLSYLASVWFLYYTNDSLIFLLPLFSLYWRTLISSLWGRRSLIFASLLFSWFFRVRFWMVPLFLIEVIRFALIYGVPLFFRRVSEELPRDAVGETAFKRAVRLLRRLRTQGFSLSMNEYLAIYEKYRQQDRAEPFSQEERSLFEKFFREFDRTALVLNNDGIILFFPSFIARIDLSGIVFNSESAMKLIDEPRAEDCPICQETLSKPAVGLKCSHQYCLKCIVPWFREKSECPLCRTVVS